ncbi:MAG: hypothetical protein ACTSRA_12920 [Promethearchaeota archaeon]
MIYILLLDDFSNFVELKDLLVDSQYDFNKIFLECCHDLKTRAVLFRFNTNRDLDELKGALADKKIVDVISNLSHFRSCSNADVLPVGEQVSNMKRMIVRYYSRHLARKGDSILFILTTKNKKIINYMDKILKLPLITL